MDATKTFSHEFRMETVRLITDGRASIAQISRDLNIPVHSLHEWIQELSAREVESYPGPEHLTSDAEIIRELKRENKRLRSELGSLKKGAAVSPDRD